MRLTPVFTGVSLYQASSAEAKGDGMQPVKAARGAEEQNAVKVLCVCCEHLAGVVPADATLVIKKGPPQCLLAPLKAICNRARRITQIFLWLDQHMQDQTAINIQVWCCAECTAHEALNLNPEYGHTFSERCKDIQNILRSLYQIRSKNGEVIREVTCEAGQMKAPTAEDGTVSGVRLAISTQGSNFSFFDALEAISD